MAGGDECLDGMAGGGVGGDEDGEGEGEGPEDGDGEELDDEEEGVGDHIARIGEGVFFPELGEEIGVAGDAGMVKEEVALEEDVDGSGCGKMLVWVDVDVGGSIYLSRVESRWVSL